MRTVYFRTMRFLLMLAFALPLFFPPVKMALAVPVRIVATFSIPADWAREIGGTHVSLETLAPADADPHTCQISPADMRKLLRADMIIALDPSFETWFTSLADASDTLRGKTFWLGTHTKAQGQAPEVRGDPHLWMDPELVIQMVVALAQHLASADPANAHAYAAAKGKYTASLRKLDAWAHETLATIPKERRLLLTYHDNLRRLAHRHGLRFSSALLDSVTTETTDPSAARIRAFIQLARKAKTPVFYDNASNQALLETLSRDASLPPPIRLHADTLAPPPHKASTYLGMYRENVRLITVALGGNAIPEPTPDAGTVTPGKASPRSPVPVP